MIGRRTAAVWSTVAGALALGAAAALAADPDTAARAGASMSPEIGLMSVLDVLR